MVTERCRFTAEARRRRERQSRFSLFSASLRLCGLLTLAILAAACGSTREDTDNREVEEHVDQPRSVEAQSDFIDIGKQAGIEWLSFYPRDQHDYPEYFEGLDKDEKRRLRLAPRGSDEKVLLHFDLPEGSKIWPVDWYGTELVAVDLSKPIGDSEQYSIALCTENQPGGPTHNDELPPIAVTVHAIAKKRAEALQVSPANIVVSDISGTVESDDYAGVAFVDGAESTYGYAARRLRGRTGTWIAVIEVRAISEVKGVSPPKAPKPVLDILSGISIKRELALEGSPKHKCTSTLEEQLGGTLRFPDGTLNLPVENGHLVRKIGGDSTIQIDGEGAEPWILLRRLEAQEAEGDIRVRIRESIPFARRLKKPKADFGKGTQVENAKLPIVVWNYSDSSNENELVGVLKAGNEVLTITVVSRGLIDGEKRRAAKAAALKLLSNATATPATEAPEFEPLEGLNIGTMGRED